MIFERNVFLAVGKFTDDKFFARVSASIYNEVIDFDQAATTFLDVWKHLI
jgi:hypothetical protein